MHSRQAGIPGLAEAGRFRDTSPGGTRRWVRRRPRAARSRRGRWARPAVRDRSGRRRIQAAAGARTRHVGHRPACPGSRCPEAGIRPARKIRPCRTRWAEARQIAERGGELAAWTGRLAERVPAAGRSPAAYPGPVACPRPVASRRPAADQSRAGQAGRQGLRRARSQGRRSPFPPGVQRARDPARPVPRSRPAAGWGTRLWAAARGSRLAPTTDAQAGPPPSRNQSRRQDPRPAGRRIRLRLRSQRAFPVPVTGLCRRCRDNRRWDWGNSFLGSCRPSRGSRPGESRPLTSARPDRQARPGPRDARPGR